ncbi:MAG: DUF2490 domain-containing protein [Flavobacteriales bacterium]
MMWNKLHIIIPLVISCAANAQFKDAGMWTSLALSAELSKKLEVSISPEVRLDENITRLASAFTDAGAQYKFSKRLSISATYRGGVRRNDLFFDPRQRLQLGVALKKKWNDFTFTYQPRWQFAIANFAGESDADFVTTVRNRFKVNYSGLKKTDISTSFETFNATENNTNLALQNWRWIGEVERSLNKSQSLSVGYLVQKSLHDSPQEMDFVLLVSYQLQLDLKKKGDKNDEPPAR